MRPNHLLLVLSTALLWISCRREYIQPETALQTLSDSLDLNDIYFKNADTGWVAAGKLYGTGALFQTTDGGETWQYAGAFPQELRYLTGNGARVYAVAYGNSVFHSTDGQNWAVWETVGWERWNALAVNAQGDGILAGGQNFGDGRILRLNGAQGFEEPRDTVEHEFCDAAFLSEFTAVLVGYGAIWRTTDGGQTWADCGVRGDFFRAVHFPSAEVGYAVGEYGALLKSTDGGQSWKHLHRANTLGNQKNRPADVFFVSEDEGYMAGQNGLFAKTDDGGESWQYIETSETTDWRAVRALGRKVFLVGSDGQLLVARF